MYENSCEMIYDMISKRVKTIKDSKGLSNVSIYEYDPSLISAIANNRRHHKKNKYLIPDGNKTWSGSDDDAEKLIDIISSRLFLPSAVELILGSESEINAYSGALFRYLILDALDSGDEKTREKLVDLLNDYIPFAKVSAFLNLYSQIDEAELSFIDEKYHSDFEDYSFELDYSIARLYRIIKNDFADMLREMFLYQANTIKLNKRFGQLVSEEIVPFLIDNRSEYLLGTDAQDMLHKSYERLLVYSTYGLEHSPDAIYYYNIEDYNWSDYLNNLIDLDIAYVDGLADIQLKSEGYPDITLFINNWNPSMCLNSLKV